MIAHKNIFILLVLNLWTTLCNAQFRVWRADTRSPTEMRAAGVFAPRGASRYLEIVPNISMYNHALGAPTGVSRGNDGYVSTTVTESTAVEFLRNQLNGNGYVYEIAASANFIQVAGTLGQFNPFPQELEYAALGGFNWDQVIRWRHYTNGRADASGLQDNNEYDARVYNTLRPSAGEPRLAGFPPNHEAWGMAPWNAFAQGGSGCGGSGRRSLHSRGPCSPKESSLNVAKRYIDDTCFKKSLCG
ncbi:putative heat-labile enterotoxin a chain [Diaporthe ampelina]|uniref:Putative heat-labile enterotoxin a chain n=1 Tax=Diaporthe ampelina TaxID=1214573 RepID=A0A0G2H2A7_9PEZI|nr:putative heat-labile enterotoxin a chain [Diaporthe ampelina]